MSGDATPRDTSVDDAVPKTFSSRRLEAYSDGVFAIAATLLVLDLSVDKLKVGSDPTSRALWDALGKDWASFLSFGISFILLGLLWGIHVRQFEFVERVDGMVLTLNTLRLLGVVLIPFTTSLTDRFNETVPGRFLLPLNFFYVVAVGWVQWRYVSSASRGMAPNMSERYRRLSQRNAFIAMVIAAGVAIASIWVGSIAFLLFIVSNVFDARDRRQARREPGRLSRRERREAQR
jgi:uncharacterized membrane protein